MQTLTATPREELTEAEVFDLLTGDELNIQTGLELLDTQNRYVDDITGDLVGGTVEQDGRVTIHGSCTLQLQRALAWGKDRVRPYMVLSNAAVSARFDLGVYVLTTPQTRQGESPITYDIQGYDLLQVLLDGPGDTYVVDPEPGVDIIDNPVFATDADDWESNPGFGFYSTAAFARVTTAPWDPGTPSLLVTWPNEGAAGGSWVNTHEFGLVVGKTYKITAKFWVPLTGPDDFRIDILFVTGSPWVTPPKETLYEIEFLWTADRADIFLGLATRDCTSGQETYLAEFHMEPLSTTCLDAVQTIVELAGAGAPVRLDGTEQVAVLPGPMVWALADGTAPSWLDIINDLLAAVNYRPLWVDERGTYRSEPYVDPKARPVEWTLDTSNPKTTLVGIDRTLDEDLWSAPNWWRFIRRGMATTPVEGDGIYTVQNTARGPSSQQSIGRVRRKPPVFLDAVDQASLVAQGDRTVLEDTSVTRTISLEVDPLPIMGHLDVVDYRDGAYAFKAEVISAEVHLDGSAGRWVLEVVD